MIQTLISTSQGDLRRSITYLQSASRLANSTSPPTPITPADIQEIAGVVPDKVVNRFAVAVGIDSNAMDMDEGPKKVKVKGFDEIRRKVKEIVREGYSASQLLTQVGRGHICRSKTLLTCMTTATRLDYRAPDAHCSPESPECIGCGRSRQGLM